MTTANNLFASLIQCNRAILSQKYNLLNILNSKVSKESKNVNLLFNKMCPIVKATIGQHTRHSLDHIELATSVAISTCKKKNLLGNSQLNLKKNVTIHYDERIRGAIHERDIFEAQHRILMVDNALESCLLDEEEQNHGNKDKSFDVDKYYDDIIGTPIQASFLLSSSKDSRDMALSSTIGRELGFAAHHAIHHMAMIKIIAIETIGLDPSELPPDFGKAPSTVKFENR